MREAVKCYGVHQIGEARHRIIIVDRYDYIRTVYDSSLHQKVYSTIEQLVSAIPLRLVFVFRRRLPKCVMNQ
jgi:hypothetical protein